MASQGGVTEVGRRIDLDFEQIKLFLLNFGIFPDPHLRPLTFRQWATMLRTAKKWHGLLFACFIADHFMPEGGPIDPGYEDSNQRYRFMCQSWEEMQEDLYLS